jgi:hypothetical protein
LNKRFTIVFSFVLIAIAAQGQILLKSPLTKSVKLLSDTNVIPYSFFVSGHWHGSSTNQSGFPASTILANIEKINNDSAWFLVSTGDIFLDVRKDIPNYETYLFNKLEKPLYNAVGNHDISGSIYEEKFGSTSSSFFIESELYIILNTECNDGSIKGEQLKFFEDALSKHATEETPIKNIFIFSHRPIWAEENEELKNLFVDNTKSEFGNNFESEILPLLIKYTKKSSIYWFSGSLGGNAPASFFYYKDKNNITYIQSAIRDLPRDGLLKVKVSHGQVSFETVSLTSQQMPKLEDCGLNLWKNPPAESFNYRLIPLYTKQMVFHRYFWYGASITLFVTVIVFFLRRRITRKKSG